MGLDRKEPHIIREQGVMGGDACLAGARIPIWLLESYRRLGWDDARILANYPTLRAGDLVNAWAYAGAHLDEIEQAIREHAADQA